MELIKKRFRIELAEKTVLLWTVKYFLLLFMVLLGECSGSCLLAAHLSDAEAQLRSAEVYVLKL